MIRVILSMLVLLSSTAFLHAEAECTRSMLQAAAASYIAAQEAGDLSKMSLAVSAAPKACPILICSIWSMGDTAIYTL